MNLPVVDAAEVVVVAPVVDVVAVVPPNTEVVDVAPPNNDIPSS